MYTVEFVKNPQPSEEVVTVEAFGRLHREARGGSVQPRLECPQRSPHAGKGPIRGARLLHDRILPGLPHLCLVRSVVHAERRAEQGLPNMGGRHYIYIYILRAYSEKIV